MAKGIIVIDIPANCLDCPIGENVSNLLEACVICQMAPKEVNPCRTDSEIEKRPDWCPIHPAPRANSGDRKYLNEYEKGWNDCIDCKKGE